MQASKSFAIGCLVSMLTIACGEAGRGSTQDRTQTLPDEVTLTWLSVTNWLLEAGDTRILFDGYVSRVDRSIVAADGSSSATAAMDTSSVAHVADALLQDRQLDWVLVGHAHWDHAFDTPAWARLTGARIVGAGTVCMQANALGIPDEQCSAVEGGESIALAPGVTARVVRWHHSGDSMSIDGRQLRAPLELRETPNVDPVSGGLRPGFLEDYPNGGGSRAYLITITTTNGPITLLWSNTGNAQTWDHPVSIDSALFRTEGVDIAHLTWAGSDRSTRDHLAHALQQEQLDSVDLWIGFGGTAHVQQVSALLHPRTFVPHHWDDFWTPLEDGPGRAFPTASLDSVFATTSTTLIVPLQYFDAIRLRSGDATLMDGSALRQRLGIRSFVETDQSGD